MSKFEIQQIKRELANQPLIASPDLKYYVHPLPQKSVWELKRHPQFPKPIRGDKGRCVYSRADIDRFLEVLAGGAR